MLPFWRHHVDFEQAHVRELAGLPGTGDEGRLPIEEHISKIRQSIRDNCLCGIRSPPGSGKTMILPELLYTLAADRQQKLQQAVMIVFPTQFGCLNIRNPLVDFREFDYRAVNLRTGVDKKDWFHKDYTKFQVVTYGMVWHWLEKGGQEARDKLFDQNCAFLLDEFSGKAEGGDPQELTADPQTIEIARLLARSVLNNSRTHRLLVTGAALDELFLKAVLPEADFLAFTGRRFPLQRVIVAPRKIEHILTLCAQLICITLENDGGNILVFLPGMDDILRLEKLVEQKLRGLCLLYTSPSPRDQRGSRMPS